MYVVYCDCDILDLGFIWVLSTSQNTVRLELQTFQYRRKDRRCSTHGKSGRLLNVGQTRLPANVDKLHILVMKKETHPRKT